ASRQPSQRRRKSKIEPRLSRVQLGTPRRSTPRPARAAPARRQERRPGRKGTNVRRTTTYETAMQGTLDRYGTAEQRIRAFYQRFPEGSIQTDLVRLEPGLLIFRARAFRDRTDPVPTTGWAYDRPGSDADGAATARILAACEAAAI